MEEYLEKIQSIDLKKKVTNIYKEFEKNILMNRDLGNKKDIENYITLLYFDTISKNDFEKIRENNELIVSLMRNPESYFSTSFEKIFSELNNSNENNSLLKNKIKSVLRNQYSDIEKKIKECDDHINLLNELFVQKELIQKIPLTSIELKKFDIKNKKVLISSQNDNLYGELFSRYIFSIIENNSSKNLNKLNEQNNSLLSFPDNFYNSENIFNFLNKNNSNGLKQNNQEFKYNKSYLVKPFEEWNMMLKYWLIYILIYEKMFEKDSNIEEITQYNNIENLAKKIREYKSSSEGKKKKQSKKSESKKKKKQGGEYPKRNKENSSILAKARKMGKIATLLSGQNQKKEILFSSEANKYKEIMKKILISKTSSFEKINLLEIMNGDSLNNKLKFFYENLINLPYNSEYLQLIFDPKDKESNIKLEKILNKELRANIKKEDINENVKIKYKDEFLNKVIGIIRIYQSLYAYRNENKEDIKNFLKQIYDNILYIYYFLYLKKKMIYQIYLNVFSEYLKSHNIVLNKLINKENGENENKKNQNENINKNKNISFNIHYNTRKIDELNQNLYNKLNVEKKIEYRNLIEKIKYLKNKKEELEKNKNQINFDKKVLVIEKLINELLIQKHQIIHSL